MIPQNTSPNSYMKTGIRDARASVASDERGHIEVTVEVFDVKHLDRVIGSIKGVPGVLDVERMQGVA
jgi:(p)ppGpp synthase/HD superfamily hydrolase